ncbi:hypothetical protein B0T16DRAFT_463172 [Cercophora newfieldiana]|uniref:Myb-like domain-containing protein n=1 Tax=Cercophora newfieldiana TaxID=92897 RepID=A0AA39XTH2_9PEZI|nr:hypothetical protein B0T16DRAFT_463172 [Cercophora newfieldiana]
MPSNGHSRSNGSTRSKPRAQSKKNRQQQHSLPTHQPTQTLVPRTAVSDDTFRGALPWGGAGYGGDSLNQAGDSLFALNVNQQQEPPRPSFGPRQSISAGSVTNGYLPDADLVKPDPSLPLHWIQSVPDIPQEVFGLANLPEFDQSWLPHHNVDLSAHGSISGIGECLPMLTANGQFPSHPFSSVLPSQLHVQDISMPLMSNYNNNPNTDNGFGSFSSSGTADMLEGMVLSNDPNRSDWMTLPHGLPNLRSFSDNTLVDLSDSMPARIQNQTQTVRSPWKHRDQHTLRAPGVSPKLLRIQPTPVPSPSASTDSIVSQHLKASQEAEMAALYNSAPPTATGEKVKGKSPNKTPSQKARTKLPDKPRSNLHPNETPVLKSNISIKSQPKGPSSQTKKASNTRKPTSRHRERSPSPKPHSSAPATKRRQTQHSLRAQPAVDYTISSPSPESIHAATPQPKPQPHGPPTPSLTPSSSQKGTKEAKKPKKQEEKKPTVADSSDDFSDDDDDDDAACGIFRTRAEADKFLVESRELGMTYKDIRAKGGFTEAESTLRGRYRTLTKSREERVRKPGWSETDIRLLEEGVRMLSRPAVGAYSRYGTSVQGVTEDQLENAKIPWKQVAEYIARNGGTYHFGNSTCRKRWDELRASQMKKASKLREDMDVDME